MYLSSSFNSYLASLFHLFPLNPLPCIILMQILDITSFLLQIYQYVSWRDKDSLIIQVILKNFIKLYFYPVGKWNKICQYSCFILNDLLKQWCLWHKITENVSVSFSWWEYNFEITFSVIKNLICQPKSKQCV